MCLNRLMNVMIQAKTRDYTVFRERVTMLQCTKWLKVTQSDHIKRGVKAISN
jgi:hypothetical protein